MLKKPIDELTDDDAKTDFDNKMKSVKARTPVVNLTNLALHLFFFLLSLIFGFSQIFIFILIIKAILYFLDSKFLNEKLEKYSSAITS
jgi:hypothetical protein